MGSVRVKGVQLHTNTVHSKLVLKFVIKQFRRLLMIVVALWEAFYIEN